jgi:thymidine kinase
MAKLYFRHGAMRSAKTLNLLAVAHNYKDQGKKTLVIKPKIDDRYGVETVQSRAGLSVEADVVVENEHTKLSSDSFAELSCILVDEAHFLPALFIDRLRMITLSHGIPVICYGLRTDFRGQLFEGSKRLMELADSIEEVKVTCQFCNRKAVFNMRFLNGKPTLSGEQIQVGGDESYAPVCYNCYHAKLGHPLS